ncbi:MAG: TauD/TfdA family dioxygenase, partial [Pseudomonadota bacterium]
MKCRALPGEAGESFAHVVDGIELWSPTSDATRQTLRDWFAEHSLLVFQRQALGDSELVQVAELFGTPREYAETHWQTSRPEVVYVSNMRGANGEFIGGLGNKELTWHTDQSYYATPVTGCFLYAAMVPREAGGTTWASLYDAYERLAPSTRNRLEDAIGTFSYRARVHHGGDRTDNHDPHRLASTPDVRHRLVQRHPRTGRRALYIDPNTVTGIEGYPDE